MYHSSHQQGHRGPSKLSRPPTPPPALEFCFQAKFLVLDDSSTEIAACGVIIDK